MTTFLEPRARLTDPDTSHDAAVLAAPRASKHRIKAARVLARFPEGLTDFELAEKTGVAQTSIGKRRFELGEAGYVEDAGLKRPAPSGSPAKVWRITEAGATWLSAIDQHPSSTEKVSEPTEPVSAERRHRSRKPRPIHPAPDRFASFVDRRGPYECWPWRGHVLPNGYGTFHAGQSVGKILAHRYALEQVLGEPLGERMALHSCDNRGCVNPAHLRPGTHAENMADMHDRGRAVAPPVMHGEENPAAKLTAEQVAEIRTRLMAGETGKDIAEHFGVSTSLVSMIRKEQKWKPRPIHPAQYPKYLVPVLANALRRHVSSPAGQWRYLLDPFAGLGHRLAAIGSLAGLEPIGIEIEPGYFERKETHPCVRLGDSTELEDIFLTATVGPTFDAIVTSPTYPNGLNDDFHARDASKRNTYIHRLREHLGDGYELHPNSTARHGIRRGAKSVARYEELHRTVLEQCALVLNPGGIFVLNAKDVLAGGETRYSTASFFVRHLESLGFEVLEWFLVDAIGLLHGANRDRRTFEDVVILRKAGA